MGVVIGGLLLTTGGWLRAAVAADERRQLELLSQQNALLQRQVHSH